jgi:hypothetical protein
MKTIVSAVVALSVMLDTAAAASALDTERFWKNHATSGER